MAKKATDYSKGFSPRIGFAYDLNGQGKHIVRAGFGMYYDNTFQNIPLFMEQQANQHHLPDGIRDWPGSDIVPGTGIPLSNWRYRQIRCRQFRRPLQPDSRLNRPYDGPELSHPGDRGV